MMGCHCSLSQVCPLLPPSPFPHTHAHIRGGTRGLRLTCIHSHMCTPHPQSYTPRCANTHTCTHMGLCTRRYSVFPSCSLTWEQRSLNTHADRKTKEYPEALMSHLSVPAHSAFFFACLGQLPARGHTVSDYSVPHGWPSQLPWPLPLG